MHPKLLRIPFKGPHFGDNVKTINGVSVRYDSSITYQANLMTKLGCVRIKLDWYRDS